MRILIDVNHPAHVHYFRNFYAIMMGKGHEVLFVSRNKEIEHRLLTFYGIPFLDRGKGNYGKIGKVIYLIFANFSLIRFAKKFKPVLFLNFLHPNPSQVAGLLGDLLITCPNQHAPPHYRLTLPFAKKVFTPSCYRIDLGSVQVRFRGYMELAYLHPNYFKPSNEIFPILGRMRNTSLSGFSLWLPPVILDIWGSGWKTKKEQCRKCLNLLEFSFLLKKNYLITSSCAKLLSGP